MDSAERVQIMKSRPFRTRNADEYNLSDVLALFVDPSNGLRSPFDYENMIVKGRMGSGKTMYLRANYAYHLFQIVPRIIDDVELVLPVFIRLSDFQHEKSASDVYRQIIIKISEEVVNVYEHLKNSEYMARVHMGMQKVPSDVMYFEKSRVASETLLKLGAVEYAQRVQQELGAKAGIKSTYVDLFAETKRMVETEIKLKPNPGIKDIESIYNTLLRNQGGKILLLIDEAGALDKSFFSEQSGDSFFEILMNQFRTADFIRTKIAVYPNSYSDILTETRYGDALLLEESVIDYNRFTKYYERIIKLIDNYLDVDQVTSPPRMADLFDMESFGDPIEQIANGSNGNYRRLVHLLDLALSEAYERSKGSDRVNYDDVVAALGRHIQEVERQIVQDDRATLQNIVKVCRSRQAYKFKYPNNALTMYRFLSKSKEYNIISVVESGAGRRSTVYAIDYCYCILKDVPTHYIKGTERIDRKRSFSTGSWIDRTTTISPDLIAQASIDGKLEGKVTWYNKGSGFIDVEDGEQYFFMNSHIIESDRHKSCHVNRKVIFTPTRVSDSLMAVDIELP